MRLFTTPEGDAGFALKGDDIVSVFKHPNAPYRNVTKSMLDLATSQGGRRLDAFDTVLPHLYAQSGFRAVARLPWNDEYTPEGWNHAHYQEYNNGRPDVVFMAHDPQAGSYQPGDGRRVQDYDEGTAHQHAAVAHAAARGDVPAAPGPESYGSGQLIRMSEGQTPITLWHGTPHEFKPTRVNPLGEFNLSKIGTGEGNQAYSRGIYKAENEGIATNYRDELSGGVLYQGKTPGYSRTDPSVLAAHEVAEHMTGGMTAAEAIEKVSREYAEAARSGVAWLPPGLGMLQKEAQRRRGIFDSQVSSAAQKLRPEDFKMSEGQLYESELHIHPDHLLHWDKPLNEQSPYIQERAGRLMEEHGMPASMHRTATGNMVHNWLANRGQAMTEQHQAHAARALLDAGIPGVKYADASTRSHMRAARELRAEVNVLQKLGGSPQEIAQKRAQLQELESKVTHNYVVFDPRTINIVKRNGLPAMVEAGADAARDHKAKP